MASPRERMVVSAALLIRERGAHPTAIADVLEHSGAPRGSAYHYFPGGRTQLLCEAVDYAGEYIAAGSPRPRADSTRSTTLSTAIRKQLLADRLPRRLPRRRGRGRGGRPDKPNSRSGDRTRRCGLRPVDGADRRAAGRRRCVRRARAEELAMLIPRRSRARSSSPAPSRRQAPRPRPPSAARAAGWPRPEKGDRRDDSVNGSRPPASSASATAASRCSSTDRTLAKIRGDKAHPASQGYTCKKALRLDHYQNGRAPADLAAAPRAPTARFEEIDWDTAIAEVAARLRARSATTHGGEKIFYYGGGGQGNHLGGAYSGAFLQGARLALPLERAGPGEDRRVLGRRPAATAATPAATSSTPRSRCSSARTRGSRTASRAPASVLKEIANDPARSMIVIDPVAPRPRSWPTSTCGCGPAPTPGAWPRWSPCSCRRTSSTTTFLAEHATGADAGARGARATSPSPTTRERCGVDEELIRAAARRIGDRRQRRDLRGPRHPAGAALHAELLPGQAALAPHRQLRQAAAASTCTRRSRRCSARRRRRPHAGHRRADHRRAWCRAT